MSDTKDSFSLFDGPDTNDGNGRSNAVTPLTVNASTLLVSMRTNLRQTETATGRRLDRGIRPPATVCTTIGLRVIPLRERSEVPRLGGSPEKATINASVIDGWLAYYSWSNFQIVGGDGIVNLGVDPDAGSRNSSYRLAADRRESRGHPATTLAYTGLGGCEAYSLLLGIVVVRFDCDMLSGFRGLCIRAEHGQAVSLPRIQLASGKQYRWVWHLRYMTALSPNERPLCIFTRTCPTKGISALRSERERGAAR
jgi:hypothetical protein